MTTATTTWPSQAELDAVEELLSVAANAIDELHLRYYQLDEEMVDDDDDVRAPSLETLGALACFLAYVDMDLDAIQRHLEAIRSAFHSGMVGRAGVRGDGDA